jgi:HEAT repeat protein
MKQRRLAYYVFSLCIIALFAGLMLIGCGKDDQGKDKRDIPPGISEEVREQVERVALWNAEERAKGAMGLGKLGKESSRAVPFLLDILDDHTDVEWVHFQGEVGVTIRTTPAAEAVKALNLIDPGWRESKDALDATIYYISVVKSSDEVWIVRKSAISALGMLGSNGAVDPLINILLDRTEVLEVRKAAATSLAEIGDQRAADAFIEVIEENNQSFRDHLVKNMVLLGEPSVDPLISALKIKDLIVRKEVVFALRRLARKRAVPPLILALKEKNEDFRRVLVAAITDLTKSDLKLVISALKHEHHNVRKGAARVLWTLKWKPANDGQRVAYLIASQRWDELVPLRDKAVAALISILKDDDLVVREMAAETLLKIDWSPSDMKERIEYLLALKSWDELEMIGKPAVPHLLNYLKDDTTTVRVNTVRTLGWIGDESAVEPLDGLLRDTHTSVRKVVVDALLHIGGEQVVKPIISALKDEDKGVRIRAIEALGELEDTRAAEPLLNSIRDEDEDGKAAAISALKKIGEPVTDQLIFALKDEDWFVRKSSVDILGSFDDARVIPALVSVLQDDDWFVRKTAAELLKDKGWEPIDQAGYVTYLIATLKWDKLVGIGKPAVEPLIKVLKEKNAGTRKSVIITLSKIKDVRAVDPLIELLKDPDSAVRKDAVDALGILGYRRAVEPLIVALKDSNIYVREAAVVALESITGEAIDEEELKRLKQEETP